MTRRLRLAFKREIKRRYPTPVSFYRSGPVTTQSDLNFVDIDPVVKDAYGIPAARAPLSMG